MPTDCAAMPMRPPSSPLMAIPKPSPTSPRTASPGIVAPSMTIALVSEARRPSLRSGLPTETPGASSGTTNAVMPAAVRFGSSSPTRASTIANGAYRAFVMNCFCPSIRHPSPTPPPRRRARARSPRRTGSRRSSPFHRIRKCRDELEDIGHDAVVGDLEDIGVWILVHRDDHLARGHARKMLDRARDAESDVEVWRDRLPSLPDLLLVRPPSGVRDGTGRSHGASERIGELLDEMPVLGALEAPAARHDDPRFRQRDALGVRRRGRELHEGELLDGSVRIDLVDLWRIGTLQRDRPGSHRDHRGKTQLYCRAHLARVHRLVRLERVPGRT